MFCLGIFLFHNLGGSARAPASAVWAAGKMFGEWDFTDVGDDLQLAKSSCLAGSCRAMPSNQRVFSLLGIGSHGQNFD